MEDIVTNNLIATVSHNHVVIGQLAFGDVWGSLKRDIEYVGFLIRSCTISDGSGTFCNNGNSLAKS